jgi:FAD/FMN-containing dehydrogenase
LTIATIAAPTVSRSKVRVIFLLFLAACVPGTRAGEIVNDITQLNPIKVDLVVAPQSVEEISALIRNSTGPISIGGGRNSQGGQTATENCLQLDMRSFKKVLALDPIRKTITVQAGITWREVQEVIDPYNLSVSIMQTYANFTVGGSLSVNCHGRYVNAGPIIFSVLSIRVVLADGSIVEASPTTHSDIFYTAIGGYGGVGVITDATLSLSDNIAVERSSEVMPIQAYKAYFLGHIRNSPTAVFHNGDIYPPAYDTVRAVTWSRTERPLSNDTRLTGLNDSYRLEHGMIWIITEMPFGKWLRQYVIDPIRYMKHPVVWRNHEASYNTAELEPLSRKYTTYVLEEYFVPTDRFDEFCPRMAEILNRHHVNVVNVSIRHSPKDPGSVLAWAKTDVFAFVLYYKQGTSSDDRAEVGVWTRELIGAAVSLGGAYYLPYQIHATQEQFRAAYPRFGEFVALKERLDPKNRFRNKLWDAYYPFDAVPAPR